MSSNDVTIKPMCIISLWTMDYSPWRSESRIELKKFMQVEVEVKHMKPILVAVASLVSKILLLLKFGQIFLSDHGPWTIAHGSEKIESNIISSKNSCK